MSDKIDLDKLINDTTAKAKTEARSDIKHSTLTKAYGNPDLDKHHLDKLVNHKSYDVRVGVSANPNLTKEHIHTLIDNAGKNDDHDYSGIRIRSTLSTHPNLTKEHIDKLINRGPSWKLAEHPNLTKEHLNRLANRHEPYVAETALNHPNMDKTHPKKVELDKQNKLKSDYSHFKSHHEKTALGKHELEHYDEPEKHEYGGEDRDEGDDTRGMAKHEKAGFDDEGDYGRYKTSHNNWAKHDSHLGKAEAAFASGNTKLTHTHLAKAHGLAADHFHYFNDNEAGKGHEKLAAHHESMAKSIKEDVDLSEYTQEELDAFLVSEDFEQLDEISGKTLGSYIQKARVDARAKYDHGRELDANPKVKAISDKISDYYNRREYTKSGASVYRKQIDNARDKRETTKKKLDPDYPKSVSGHKRSNNIDKAIRKLQNGKLTEDEDFNLEDPIKETLDMSADIDALFNGETLTEEFKEKASTIFEAAITSRLNEKVEEIEAFYANQVKEIQEEAELEVATQEDLFAQKLDEQIEEVKVGLVEHVDGFLNFMVEQWMKDNEVALESGIKAEIAENLVSGLHKLFTENYVEVPEAKVDLVEELEASVLDLEAKLSAQVKSNIELNNTINEAHREFLVDKTSAGLTELDADKFRGLVEELSYDNAESFEGKLVTIKENYFTKKTTSVKVKEESLVITDAPVVELTESVSADKKVNPMINAYLKNLSK